MIRKFITLHSAVKQNPVLSVIVFCTILYSAPVFINSIQAQEKAPDVKQENAGSQTPPAAPGENAPEGSNAAMSVAGKVHFGEEPTIWVLIILFNLAIAVSIERIWILRKNKSNNAELVKLLSEKLSGNPQSVSDLEENVGANFGLEGRVASVTLKGWNHGEDTMKEYTDAAIKAERRFLEKRLVVLSTLGNNTPFIGLLGAVLGIMKAFRDLAAMGDSGPVVVMKGISEALVATAAGLAVAIPCVIAYNALSKIVKDKISCAEEVSSILLALRLSVKK